MFTDKGMPSSLYTDRGSHYFHTPEAGGKVAKDRHTQVGRALHQLGIEHIAAYSPEARGRSERAFGTLQDRLVKELALAGIATVEAADRFIADNLPARPQSPLHHPAPNSKTAPSCPSNTPARSTTSSVAAQTARSPATTPCATKGASSRSPPPQARHHYVKARVRVHEYPDGTLALFHGPRCLARYTANGEPIENPNPRGRVTRFDATGRRPVDKWTAAPRLTTSPQGKPPTTEADK